MPWSVLVVDDDSSHAQLLTGPRPQRWPAGITVEVAADHHVVLFEYVKAGPFADLDPQLVQLLEEPAGRRGGPGSAVPLQRGLLPAAPRPGPSGGLDVRLRLAVRVR
jgi:hypothetical protein